MRIPEPYIGKWRITHMEQWDQDYVDLVTTGHVTIRKNGTGGFQFGVVQGEMDCRMELAGSDQLLAFTWDGSDEFDPVSGRGWVKVNGKEMQGHLFIHLGDDSAFTAKKVG